MIEYRYCAETVYFGDGPAMVCSREIVEDHCPKHGNQPRSHVDEKRTAMIAGRGSAGMEIHSWRCMSWLPAAASRGRGPDGRPPPRCGCWWKRGAAPHCAVSIMQWSKA